MKAIPLFVLLLSFCGTLFPLHAEESNQDDHNLQAFVDFEHQLDQVTPSTLSTQALRSAVAAQDIASYEEVIDAQDQLHDQSSKTSLFQQTFVKYVKDIYNQRNYAQALSQDASHIIQFLEISNEMNLGPEIVYVCMRLFYNKFKASELVDDTVVIDLLHTVPELINRHFVDAPAVHDLSFIKKQLETLLIGRLTDHLATPSVTTDNVATQISCEITTLVEQEFEALKKQMQKNEIRQRLRTMVIRFFDLIINKTIWIPQQPEIIWKSFNAIAGGIQLLGLHNIINHMDDLDDLLWSQTHRFCFFLELAGASLPTEFYERMEHDLEGRSVFFLEYKEQDEGITSKKETLALALLQAKAKAFAYQRSGIIPAHMI